jgi:hypothetical protein
MKNYLKVSALAAVLLASATYASAVAINLNSGIAGTTTNYNGFTLGTGGTFNDLVPVAADIAGGGPTGTTAIGTGLGTLVGTWIGPISGTSYITGSGFGGSTEPGGVVVPNGYYEFTTSFTTVGGTYTGSISVLADDTVAVFLNGTAAGNNIIKAGVIGGDGRCSDNVPNCASIDTVSFGSATAGFNSNGVNTLTFIVEQTGHSAMGLDYKVSIDNGVTSSPVPEPNSLLLLGTGLVGAAGTMFRRMRR